AAEAQEPAFRDLLVHRFGRLPDAPQKLAGLVHQHAVDIQRAVGRGAQVLRVDEKNNVLEEFARLQILDEPPRFPGLWNRLAAQRNTFAEMESLRWRRVFVIHKARHLSRTMPVCQYCNST